MFRYILLFFILFSSISFGFDFKNSVKKINPFKKRTPAPKAKMVETRQEWLDEAQNIPLEEREPKKPEVKKDKKYYIPEPHYVFEKYNYPAGHRELNVDEVKKKTYLNSYLVADINCKYAAYSRYFFSPDSNQISSNFYVEKLDSSKVRVKRILDYNHNALERKPIIEAGTKEIYPNLYRGLTLVDWSADSSKLLIKEKVGSVFGGIYKTYLYVHFMETDIENAYTIKLDDFDRAIKDYYLDYKNLQLVKYKYEIVPLGFSAEDDDVVVAHCFLYDEKNNKIFLGTWGYDCVERETFLISKTNPSTEISANGLIIRRTVE